MSQPDRHPIAAYVFTIGGAISWSSKRQTVVALSTTEAEYMALAHATKEALWLSRMTHELFGSGDKPAPIKLYSDNQGAVALSKNSIFHGRTKHVEIRYHFTREHVESGAVMCQNCLAHVQ